MGRPASDVDPESRGGRLRAARERLGLKQEDLAGLLGKTAGFISDVERGRRNVTLDWLADVADKIGVPRSSLSPELADVAPAPPRPPSPAPLPGQTSFLDTPGPVLKRKPPRRPKGGPAGG